MARVFSNVDLLLVPSLRDEMLMITNSRGSVVHPASGLCGSIGSTQRLGADPTNPCRSSRRPGEFHMASH